MTSLFCFSVSPIKARTGAALLLVLAAAACGSTSYEKQVMSPPAVFANGVVNPFNSFPNGRPFEAAAYEGVLYATDRQPVDVPEGTTPDRVRYENRTGFVLRLGAADVRIDDDSESWEEVVRNTLNSDRPRPLAATLENVTEWGILPGTVSALVKPAFAQSTDPRSIAAAFIERQLARSPNKQITIYVPGARSLFDDTALETSQLWHFSGYDGVYLAYAWPSQPTGVGLSYFGDAEATVLSGRNLRLLVEFLSQQTSAERINIVTYSAGSRVASQALEQLALKGGLKGTAQLGDVILTGGDVDQTTFAGYLSDGILEIVERMTIYANSSDLTLGVASFIFGRERIGQIAKDGSINSFLAEYLRNNDKLILINVSDVIDDGTPFGHSYFRSSPIVSSDIFVTLRGGLTPTERGLIQTGDNPVWTFPKDYARQLRARLNK